MTPRHERGNEPAPRRRVPPLRSKSAVVFGAVVVVLIAALVVVSLTYGSPTGSGKPNAGGSERVSPPGASNSSSGTPPRIGDSGSTRPTSSKSCCSSAESAPPPPPSSGPMTRLPAALKIARAHDLSAGVAVLDTESGAYRSNDTGHKSKFATASVVKVLIAARLLLEGKMHGSTAPLAEKMITKSDDDAANVLWGVAGGPELEPAIERHYKIDDLGSTNTIPGFWGSTQVTAPGMARLLDALRHDPKVWPWLHHALAHSAHYAADGTDQQFGILAADPGAEVKQGWAFGSVKSGDSAIDSAGYTSDGRYVVVILTEGRIQPDSDYSTGFDRDQAEQVGSMAKALLN